MLLYHGTSWVNAKKILENSRIKVSNRELSHYKVALDERYFTTPGYVYLTNYESEAKKYGNNAVSCAIMESNETSFEDYRYWTCIFEVNIDIQQLEPDIDDECKIRLNPVFPSDKIEKCALCNAENCLEKIKSARYPRELIIGTDVKRYKIYHVNDNYKTGVAIPVIIQDWIEIQ